MYLLTILCYQLYTLVVRQVALHLCRYFPLLFIVLENYVVSLYYCISNPQPVCFLTPSYYYCSIRIILQKHNRLLSPFISIIIQKKEKITLFGWVRSDDIIHKFVQSIKRSQPLISFFLILKILEQNFNAYHVFYNILLITKTYFQASGIRAQSLHLTAKLN